MSMAGRRSNRGDIYQTLVAFNWALSILANPEYEWLELDSISHHVDDIVIGKTDGSFICCQCKKNEQDFKAWSYATLKDELQKAILELKNHPNTTIYFYSRNNFGGLAKIQEYSQTVSTEAEYHANLTKEHRVTNDDLASCIREKKADFSVYEFLNQVHFQTTNDVTRGKELIVERLSLLASNPRAAFSALWEKLDFIGGHHESDTHASSPIRLTKESIEELFNSVGAMLTPPISEQEIRDLFAHTSNIGRQWQREIAGKKMINPVIGQIQAAVDAGNKSILLTGLPGSGKTCVMLDLQEALEHRMQEQSNFVSLFIQSREFADAASTQERASIGLPENWVEKIARLADTTHIVVIIDSLDALSIAREHSVLNYFLAQIDRLLLIPQVTVITACRDFDRKYERAISVRKWDKELQCLPFNWAHDITPLLHQLSIDTSAIDEATRTLISNPRELSLFIELAQREGSFSIITAQALTQKYLDTVIQADTDLGGAAMEAIENIADEMLKARSLSISRQRFTASDTIFRRLKSLNILQETHDNKLTFGHQTLLDILVISKALRQGVTLNEFIQTLPPVPFVRPSIRSFIMQLASEERRIFRQQLRAVLSGQRVFHIRRLVAETFAQYAPQDDDWPLLRDLYKSHPDIFQVIYMEARSLEWHHFWLKFLIPFYKQENNQQGLIQHFHHLDRWKNQDAVTVFTYWKETLELDKDNTEQLIRNLSYYLRSVDDLYLPDIVPILDLSLKKSIPTDCFFGQILARCVSANLIDDVALWSYIIQDIDTAKIEYFYLRDHLRCSSHEFGEHGNQFLKSRFQQSTLLLDLAIKSIEEWSQQHSYFGLLLDTSYEINHSDYDFHSVNKLSELINILEETISWHAKNHTAWWQSNRHKLCFHHEEAFKYIAIITLSENPLRNIDLITELLADKGLLQSRFSDELSKLIQNVFIDLPESVQNSFQTMVLALFEEETPENNYTHWVWHSRMKYISSIPIHLRSENIQNIASVYEAVNGKYIYKPDVYMRGGVVSAPFSYDVFLNLSNQNVIKLLAHYAEYDSTYDDYLIGGKSQVNGQLQEAASRSPIRFFKLLTENRDDIAELFRDGIMDGIAHYLAYRHGNLGHNENWQPIETEGDELLVIQIIDDLKDHQEYWHNKRDKRVMASTIEACSHLVFCSYHAEQLVRLAEPYLHNHVEDTVFGDVDLITQGINTPEGKVVQALIVLLQNFLQSNQTIPTSLAMILQRFAQHPHPALRALMLNSLAYIQNKMPDWGWALFDLLMQDAPSSLWKYTGSCLYYGYHDQFEKINCVLKQIESTREIESMEIWGRISALCAFQGDISLTDLLDKLNTLKSPQAWDGASKVWTHKNNICTHREQCLTGIQFGLESEIDCAIVVADNLEHIFRENKKTIVIPADLLRRMFEIFKHGKQNKYHHVFNIEKWLNTIVINNPDLALSVLDSYLDYVKQLKLGIHDSDNEIAQLMTRLFAEAEEQEEADSGEMLAKIVNLQDILLSLGNTGMEQWLKAAERP